MGHLVIVNTNLCDAQEIIYELMTLIFSCIFDLVFETLNFYALF